MKGTTVTIDQLIAQVRQSIADKLTKRATHTAQIDEVRALCLEERRDPSDDEAAKVKAARAAADTIDTEVDELRAKEAEYLEEKKRDEAAAALSRELTPSGAGKPAYDQVGRVGQEPRTYTRDTASAEGVSFFSDAWNAQRGNANARARLERHAREVEVHGEMTERALNTGGVAGLVVPQYLVDLAAPVLRAGRPLANIVNRHQLPEKGMSLIIPRGTTGASTATQATENSAVSSTDEVWANLTVPVTTIAGQQAVSRQTLERGEAVDEIIYVDLARAYAANVDNQVINGTGASNQVLGILNTGGINAATAFGAAVTPTNFTLKVAGQIAAVTSGRRRRLAEGHRHAPAPVGLGDRHRRQPGPTDRARVSRWARSTRSASSTRTRPACTAATRTRSTARRSSACTRRACRSSPT
jgi:HK97 family phage major capsid protein